MKQLDPKAVWIFFVSSVLSPFIAIIIASLALLWFDLEFNLEEVHAEILFGVFNWFLTGLFVIIPAFLILCFIWAKLTYRFYRYELTDAGFRKEFGVIYKRYTTIPYDRIQNVDIHRGILARILGLSNLNIQTAGMNTATTNSEGLLPALSREDAERLRDELIQRARQSKNQGL